MDKKAIAIWLTDTHLSENTIEINNSIFRQVFSLCVELGVDSILHGGDVFTSRKGQSEIVLKTFKNILDFAAKTEIKIYAISGNHDKTDGNSDSSFLDVFKGHPGISVIEPGDTLIQETISKPIKFHFLSYFDEQLTYPEKLENVLIDKNAFNILLTHVAVNGVKSNGGVTIDNEISFESFSKFDLVLVGHYHNRQVFGNIVYTGSAYQANFGEDVDKGCVIIYDDGSYEFMGLDFPQYVTVDILPQDLDSELARKIKDKSSESRVRVRIAGDVGEGKEALVSDLEKHGVKIEIEKESYKPIENMSSDTVMLSSEDVVSLYDAWAKDKKIKDVKAGKQILQSVL